MKVPGVIALFAFIGVIFSCSRNQPTKQKITEVKKGTLEFDSILAKKHGADEFGMRQYVMAILKEGSKRDQDSIEVNRLQRAHLDNINRLADKGVLVLAGPFLDDAEMKGIYVFAVESVAEAKKLTESDSAIKAGRLVMDLHPWYGSAALMDINELHKRISKVKI